MAHPGQLFYGLTSEEAVTGRFSTVTKQTWVTATELDWRAFLTAIQERFVAIRQILDER